MPIVWAIILQICLYNVLKYDSLMFLLVKGKEADALEMISRVYKCESEEQKQEIMEHLKSEMSAEFKEGEEEAEVPGMGEVCTSRKFRKATWVVFAWTFFYMWAGIDALNMYSNVIIVQMNAPRVKEGKSPFFSAEVGSVLVGVTQFVGGALAYFTVTKFGRVPLLVWGHLIMGIIWAAIGVATIYAYNFLAILLMGAFILIFSMTEGPLIWIYMAESLNDAQLGIAGLGFTVNLLLIAYITEYLIKWIKPEGLYFLFCVSTLIGGVFIKVFLKETHGLSDHEKMNLYLPKDLADA